MATKVTMPQLGESVTEGTITRWIKQVGETVKKYEPLCEVETDKVTAEVPATVSGTLSEIEIEAGTTVEVGQLICYIQEEGQALTEVKQEENNTKTQDQSIESESKTKVVQQTNKIRYSPAVLHLAQEHQIDLNQVTGTGFEGRVTRKDVLRFIEAGGNQGLSLQAENREEIQKEAKQSDVIREEEKIIPDKETKGVHIDQGMEDGDQAIDITNVRKTIAKRMVQSKHEAPHAWLTVEADVTDLVHYRDRLKNDFKKNENFNLTYLPFFIKAVVEALKEFSIVNSVWAEDKIILKKRINISIAVATDNALYVPVIKDADQKSIYGIAKSIDELVKKTRAGKLTLADFEGGTFTVNNTGSFGSILSAPIINSPQAGIITMESIIKKPVIHQEMIAVRSMVNLCMSLDHRILDGLVAGRFMQSVKQRLEEIGKKEISIY